MSTANNKYSGNHPNTIGSSLVFDTRYVKLDEQVRATDPNHAAVVEKLARGEGISFESLKTYKVLSSDDYADPESPWYEAPIVVTINRDRFSLVHLSAMRFARSRGTVVLRWKSLHSLFRQRPPPTNTWRKCTKIPVSTSISLPVQAVVCTQPLTANSVS
jgi:hypothetical protein